MNTARDFEFNDDLSDLLDGRKPVEGFVRQPKQPPASYFENRQRLWEEGCSKCGGTGSWHGRGQCFACKGKGKLVYKTSPEARAKSRAGAEDRKRKQAETRQQEIAAWQATFKAEWEWMLRSIERNPKFDFPAKMIEAVAKWGSLTDGQLNAIRNCMAKDAAWAAKRQQADADKPTVDVSRLEAAFNSARDAAAKLNPNAQGIWVRPLRLRDGGKDDPNAIDLSFSPGSPGSEWDGMIFVRTREEKIGWIKDHKFTRRFACTDAQEAAIGRVLSDPAQAAKAYAQAWKQCGVCSRTLTKKESIERGIGPICAEMMGWG